MNNALTDMAELVDNQLINIKENSVRVDEKKTHYDLNKILTDVWAVKSHDLAQDFVFGINAAQFGINDMNMTCFLKRLCSVLYSILNNMHQKIPANSNYLKPHIQILDSTFQLIAKDIERCEYENIDVLSLISSLQGFILNYKENKMHD